MKKVIYSLSAIAMLAIFMSCSSQTAEQATSTDSTAVDSAVCSTDTLGAIITADTIIVKDTLTK